MSRSQGPDRHPGGPPHHRVAGLLYAEPARLAETPAQADHAVTFTACADHHTPFIGGFFVLEPRCVPLEIRPAAGRPVREVISFFAGDCPHR